jgi:hypothetical protein
VAHAAGSLRGAGGTRNYDVKQDADGDAPGEIDVVDRKVSGT